MVSFRLILLVILVPVTGWGCSSADTVRREVSGHRFKIPSKYVVDATVAFLPASQGEVLRFVINPSAPQQQQNMVSIHPGAKCPPSDASLPRPLNCKVVPTTLAKLLRGKLSRVGNDTWWEYRFVDGGELVAFCSGLEKSDGLCTHYGLYKGLRYELALRDSQMPNLITLRRTTDELLSTWERTN